MNHSEFIRRFERLIPQDGVLETPVEGVRLFQERVPVALIPGVYQPAACVILQGHKRAWFDGRAHDYRAGHYLCSAIPLPVDGQVVVASADKPLLGVMVSFQSRAMSETCVAFEAALDGVGAPEAAAGQMGLIVGRVDDSILAAITRLLEALEDPLTLAVAGEARLRELLFAFLRGPAGPTLRRRLGRRNGVSGVIGYISENLSEDLAVDGLAKRAGMSKAVFHRRFREVTGLSPLQFIKSLRLNDAARLIAEGTAVGAAARAVGYASASQFSREFRRHFGESPREWKAGAASLRPDVQASAPVGAV